MLIKCPNCNHDNQLGAIFCRNCGAKLDIEKLAPKVRDRIGINFAGIIRNLITLLVVLGFAGFVAAIFVPYGHKEIPPLPADQMKETKTRVEEFIKRCQQGYGRTYVYTFSPAEATYGFNTLFLEKIEGDQGAGFYIDELIIDLDERRDLVLNLKTRLAGKVPILFSLTGMPIPAEIGEGAGEGAGEGEGEGTTNARVSLKIRQGKIGHLPVPGAILPKVIEKYEPLLDGKMVNEILAELDSIVVDEDGNLVFELKKPQVPAPGRKKN
jgi:hypothetical protein